MDNVQKHNTCINVPSTQTFRSYLIFILNYKQRHGEIEKRHVFYFIESTLRPSDRRLLAKLVPTFADRECRVVSATDPPGR
jgi:hypothetical protein